MYARILVPVDGSSTSERALREAIKFATEQKARLRLVNVVDVMSIISGDSAFLDTVGLEKALVDSGEELLKKSLSAASAAGVEADTKLLKTQDFSQRIADMIVGEAAAWPADLIVVGTHGRRGWSHLFLGSVAEGIVRASTTPVLLIRGQ